MLDALDRHSRDSTLFQFTTRRLRDFIDPNHLLIQIDDQFDFQKLVEPLEDFYCRDNGRPAIHPEVLVRALLISSLYNVSSFRRLCAAISENLAFRWFCFLSIDEDVFHHSTISYFIERVGNEGFGQIFQRFNEELLRLGLLSRQVYADSSLVRANVSSSWLSPSGMSVEEFKEKAVEENGLFVLREQKVDEDGEEQESVSYYQDRKGRLPLSQVDTDARWRTTRKHDTKWKLHYQENVIVERGGFIVARTATHASVGEWKAMDGMLKQLPVKPETFTADAAYRAGRLRKQLDEMGIVAYIPFHPNQLRNMVAKGSFDYRGDHLVCPEGKVLRRSALLKQDRTYQYVARQHDCQRCPIKTECLPPGQMRRYVALSIYHSLHMEAKERNEGEAYRMEMLRRKTIAEGVFASQDRLGWARSRLRGLWKVDCEGYISSLAHNLKKAVRRLGNSTGPPKPASAPACVAVMTG